MSHSTYFKSRTDLLTLGGGGLEGETENLRKRLEWRNRDKSWWVE